METDPAPRSRPPARPPTLVLLGPTAVGKSAVAMALAEELAERGTPGEIVNADALQVYKGFDVGTAKPTPADQARVPHHLVDILEPHQRYSAGEFARRAREAIDDIHRRGGRALVVGGSGLYLRALLEGLSPVPRGDREVRQRLRKRLKDEGIEVLYQELEQRDPVTAERLPPADTQRILRALEVVEVSGTPLSEWIDREPFGTQRLPSLRIGLTLPRPILYDRIAVRVDRMVERGWLDEVRRLLDIGLTPDLPAFQAIGYRQLVRHVRGEISLDAALEELTRQTRRFAKRQETWFRKEPHVAWFRSDDLEELVPAILKFLERGRGRAYA